MMTLPGYLDGYEPPVDPAVLTDANAWLDRPEAWPALLWALGGARTAVDAFDIDAADVDVMLTQLSHPGHWPFFTVDLAGAHRIHLVWRNFPDESGWDYLLAGKTFAELVPLAQLDAHFRGPGMSWPELIAMANQADAPLDRARRLLLLLPALGDADCGRDAVTIVADALTAIGALRHQNTVAHELLAASRRFWGDPPWHERDGIITCLGGHSFRGPGAPPGLRQTIAAALGSRS